MCIHNVVYSASWLPIAMKTNDFGFVLNHYESENCSFTKQNKQPAIVSTKKIQPIANVRLQAHKGMWYCDDEAWCHTLRPRQNCRHFADDIFKCLSLNENIWILLKISLNLVHRVWIDNIQALVQIMTWGRPGAKPLSEPMMANLLTHITRPQWGNPLAPADLAIISKLIIQNGSYEIPPRWM